MSRHRPPDDAEPLDDALVGLIAAERRHPGPVAGTDARVKAAVMATVGIGAMVGSGAAAAASSAAAVATTTTAASTAATTAASTAATTAATTTAVSSSAGLGAVSGFTAAAKSGAIIAAALVATAGGTLYVSNYEPTSTPVTVEVTTPMVPAPPAALVIDNVTPEPPQPAIEVRPRPTPPRRVSTPAVAPLDTSSESGGAAAFSNSDSPADAAALAAERAVLIEAREALTRDDSQSALVALEAHRDGWPEGRLTEEREALLVMALARAGQLAPAMSAAARFRARYPRSLFVDAVNRSVAPTP